MTCAMLIIPHSNARYYRSLRELSLCELLIMSREIPGITNIRYETISGIELLLMDISEPDRAIPVLSRHSSCQAMFEVNGEWLKPLLMSADMAFEADIASVLKYKGKTNERFTHLLINVAVFSGAYSMDFNKNLSVLDPLCGRGTTLFQSLRLGYNASGIDIDAADIKELTMYISRYLEYHKVKHSKKKGAMTAHGENAGERFIYSVGGQVLCAICADTLDATSFFKKSSFDAIAVDLPYGVQHTSRSGRKHAELDELMVRALPLWHSLLKNGAAAALSFNAYGITREKLRGMLKEAGFSPIEGGAYDGMRHWVEQAVDRDIVVGIKE